jgi:DNA-binding HxlR family transcriptional regulator
VAKESKAKSKGQRRNSAGSGAHAGGNGEARFCPRFHHAVELIGRRWSGAIINAMLPGPQCFNELMAIVPGLSDRLLTERLREFESEGLVERTVITGPPIRVSYKLTRSGKDLEPVIVALSKWAEKWIELSPEVR